MPEFTKGEIYGGMMKGFAQAFGDAMTEMPTGEVSEVAFGTMQTWAGVTFEFRHGASSDFPAASILVPSWGKFGFPCCKHPDRREGILYALDSGKGTYQSFAGIVSGWHRC